MRLPLQIAFVLLLTAFISRTTYLRWDEVRAIQVRAAPAWMAAGIILTMAFTYGLSLSWQWLVRHLSSATSELSSLGLHRVFFTSFLSRYLPAGSLVTMGGKVEMLKRQGASRSVGLESVLYEIVFLMGGGLFLGWVAFLVAPAPQFLAGWEALYPILMVAMVAVWVLCFAVPDRVLLWGRSLLKRELPELSSARLSWVDRLVAFVLYTCVNLLQGAAVLCMLIAVYPGMPRDAGTILHVLAAYPIGRLVGQAAPFAPGGIGVREATFVFLVAPWLPLQPVLVAATLMRLISILVEVLAASMVLGLGRLRGSSLPQRGSDL
jgi:glycosyltransferase 2 family protein